MTTDSRTSLTVEVRIDAPVEHVFTVFTEDFDSVKPHDHSLLAVPLARTELDPWVGGTIRDIGVDGSVCTWARILELDPPRRIVFSWDIGPTWRLETDPTRTSEVDVRFDSDGDGGTIVRLEHRHLDRHSAGWESFLTLDRGNGWPLYLHRLVRATRRPA